MPAGYSFRPRAWAFAAAAAACAAGIALGHWQAGRADEKRALGARLELAFKAPPLEIPDGKIDPRDYVMKHVAARGRFADEHTVYLDNKLRHGRPGYEVVTPLRLDGVYVLVNRGWVEAGRTRAALPCVPARLKLVAVLLVCASPFVLAWAAWHFKWGTGSAGNYGELIAPQPRGEPAFQDLRGKWVLVTFDAAACDAYCQRKLYFMRQVRTAQGKDQARIERVWVITDGGAPRPELLAAIEGTRIARVRPDGFPGNPVDHIY